MKRRQFGFYLFIFILSLVAFNGCNSSHEGRITILHTNDLHCQYVPMTASWIDADPKPEIGGMIALDYYVDQMRRQYPNSLLLDAGDMLTGTPLARIEASGAIGGGFADMMNLLDYDATTIGNHEFDNGQENISRLIRAMDFDVLCANLFINGKQVAPKGYEIYRVGNIRVGVIGLTMGYMTDIINKKYTPGVTSPDPLETAQKIVKKIDPKTDVIILLIHQGIEYDRELAEKIENVDVIVGGHSHTRLEQAEKHNGVLVVQAGSKTRYLGRLTIDVAGDSVAAYESELVPVWVDSVKNPDPQMVELVQKYQNEIDKEYNVQVGTLLSDWSTAGEGECNIGNFIADAFREVCEVDFALVNKGGIRKGLEAGPIRKLNIVEIMPFSNYLLTFEATGEELITIARHNAESLALNNKTLLQFSGLTFSYSLLPDGTVKLEDVRINGAPVDPSATYRGATVDYVLDGGAERYMGFKPASFKETGMVDVDALFEYLSRHPQVDSKIEGRIKQTS